MPPVLIAFLVVFALLVVYLVVQAKRAGPPQLPEETLAAAMVVTSATADAPGAGWSLPGSKTTTDGLRIRFDHDDDPQAEAIFLVDPRDKVKRGSMALNHTVRLTSDFETHHIHTLGHVFRIRLRGTGTVVGREVRIQMRVKNDGTPVGGQIENDDDIDAAVGDWIDVEKVEILRVR